MAFDREGTLRKAEKLLRQGRLDGAIAEYLRVVENQPLDWNTANVLGDLYFRSGQTEAAVAQYSRIAEHLAQEGFVSKATALYKKIVKITPEDESALLRASELSGLQGLTAEAKAYLTAAYRLRLHRGDRFGAAQLAGRLAAMDPADISGRLKAAKANADWGDGPGAARQYKSIADELAQRGQATQALEVLAEAVRLDASDSEARKLLIRRLLDGGNIDAAQKHASATEDLRVIAAAMLAQGREDEALPLLLKVLESDPEDLDARLRLARAYIARRDLPQATHALGDIAPDAHPQVLLTLAEIELRARHVDAAGRVLRSLLLRDQEQTNQIVLLGCALAESYPEAGFECITAVVDTAVLKGDLESAVSVVERFVARATGFIPALLKLVEICVDGSFEHELYRAQARLADAYLATGQWTGARAISEDLFERRPDDAANVERLKSALQGLGVPDPDGEIAERLRLRVQDDVPFEFSPGGSDEILAPGPETPEVPPEALAANLADTLPAEPTAVDEFLAGAAASSPESAEPMVPVAEPVAFLPASEEPPIDEPPPPSAQEALSLEFEPDAGPIESSLSTVADSAEDQPVVFDSAADSTDANDDEVEVDLSDAITDLLSESGVPSFSQARRVVVPDARKVVLEGEFAEREHSSEPPGFDELFGAARGESEPAGGIEAAALQLAEGQALLRAGRVSQARRALESAVRSPAVRFDAAALLGRIARDSGDPTSAVEWFERAAEAPSVSPTAGQALLYELGDTLEALGERARALAVFLELQASAPEYRDVARRVDWLTGSRTSG